MSKKQELFPIHQEVYTYRGQKTEQALVRLRSIHSSLRRKYIEEQQELLDTPLFDSSGRQSRSQATSALTIFGNKTTWN